MVTGSLHECDDNEEVAAHCSVTTERLTLLYDIISNHSFLGSVYFSGVTIYPHIDAVRLPPGPSVLNITDEMIVLEYNRKYPAEKPVGSIIGSIAGTLVLVILTAALVAIVYKVSCRTRRRDQSSTLSKSKIVESEMEHQNQKEKQIWAIKYCLPCRNAMKVIKVLKGLRKRYFLFREDEVRGFVNNEVGDDWQVNENNLRKSVQEWNTEKSTRETQERVSGKKEGKSSETELQRTTKGKSTRSGKSKWRWRRTRNGGSSTESEDTKSSKRAEM